MDKAKPFGITKREVWEAHKRVKANRGAAGVDDQTIEEFDGGLENNLDRLWNRMESGSYMPLSVRRVDISKGEGKTRPLGIPDVSDRIAQAVAGTITCCMIAIAFLLHTSTRRSRNSESKY